MEQRAPLLLLTLIAMLTVSNGLSVLVSYGTGVALLPFITLQSSDILSQSSSLTTLFNFPIPQLVSPDKAMMAGITFGLVFSLYPQERLTTACLSLRTLVNKGLSHVFIPVLPLYVFGFVLKLQYEGTLSLLFKNFGQVLVLICALIVLYCALLYFIGSGFNVRRAKDAIREMLPAVLTGFSTMSSAATMPVTLAATEKNTEDSAFSQLVIPTTSNIHLLGDGLGIPLIALAVMGLFSMEIPSLATYLVFVGYYCIAKFSAAGIPGGGVMILLPVMEVHLGLTAEMASLVATIYILMDPIFTSGNVTGNGAFAMIAQRVCYGFKLIRRSVA